MTSHSNPKSLREMCYVFFTGFCMGAADVVPGVSGGTMAFIMGVYEDLLNGIKSVNLELFKKFFRGDLRGCFQQIPVTFLALLGGGILIAIVSLASKLKYALTHHESLLFSFFFGLILASVLVLARQVHWNLPRMMGVVAGAAIGFLIVTLTPQDMPHDFLTLLICGSIAIMAMILPGISGSFLLLILGQYGFILGCVDERNVLPLIPVALGAVIGLMGFSRVLSWLLAKWHHATVAILIGFMVGSLRKIWPWKEITNSVELHGKTKVLADRMVLPEMGTELLISLGLGLFGFVLVLLIERIQHRKEAVASA